MDYRQFERAQRNYDGLEPDTKKQDEIEQAASIRMSEWIKDLNLDGVTPDIEQKGMLEELIMSMYSETKQNYKKAS